jgi:hypothetical protein
MRAIKWLDEAGNLRVADQYTDVDLPEHLADRALRCAACVSITDDRRKHLRGAHGGRHPNPEYAVDLDADDDRSGVQRDASRATAPAADFEVIDRGPPRTGTIQVQRVS